MVMVDGLQVPAPGKGATGEITIPPKACRWVSFLLSTVHLVCLLCLP